MLSTGGLEYVDPSLFVADGEWHHIAITFNGDEATLSMDGQRGLGWPLYDFDLADGEVVAGAAPATGGLAWVGWLDDVKVFARERTQADLAQPDQEDARGLMLWWDFEVTGSGSGVTVPDRSGGGFDGISGGSSTTPAFLPCR